MNLSRLALLVLATATALAGAEGATVSRALATRDGARGYLLHLPPAAGTARLPLVIALHPMLANGSAMEALSGFSAIADREGFVVVYPEGLNAGWDYGQPWYPYDDVGFIAAVVDAVAAATPIDRDRVFATGMSAGGFMSNLLAVERSDLVAAIAPVVGGLLQAAAAELPTTRPVPVLLINGTSDVFVPYAGCEWPFYTPTLAAPATASLWAFDDGATAAPTDSLLPDAAWWDGCRVHVRRWAGRAGSEVLLYTIEGGGHTWPGSILTMPFGNVCYDFSASETIWRFFRAHPRAAGIGVAGNG
jgi:polyhydroxybutyrate depolymerase